MVHINFCLLALFLLNASESNLMLNTLVELNQATPVYVWARTNYGIAPQLIHLYEIDYVRLWDPSLYWYDCALTK